MPTCGTKVFTVIPTAEKVVVGGKSWLPPSENTQGQSCHHDQPFKFSLVPLIKTLKLKPWSKPTQRAHLLSFKMNSSSSSIPEGLCKARPCLKSVGYSGYTSNPLQSHFLPSSFRLDSPFNECFPA